LTLPASFEVVEPTPLAPLIDPEQEETKLPEPCFPEPTFSPLFRGELNLCTELEELLEILDLKSNKFVFYCRVRVEGTLEEATKDNSTQSGLRGMFTRKSRVEEIKSEPEEEVFLLLGTDTFHLIPLDKNEHNARHFSYLEIEKITSEKCLNCA
jgi:hypothetical protein